MKKPSQIWHFPSVDHGRNHRFVKKFERLPAVGEGLTAQIVARHWTSTETPVQKTDEIDQRADSRCPQGRAGGIKAR
jgi:hypothetical protein